MDFWQICLGGHRRITRSLHPLTKKLKIYASSLEGLVIGVAEVITATQN